jgi:tetratricopeptide (TPR) repeat protein
MKKSWLILLIILIVIAGLAIAAVVFWPWLSSWLGGPEYVDAWVGYITGSVSSIGEQGSGLLGWAVLVLLLVGLIELVWALTLGRRSGAFDRQWKRLERLHGREVGLLNQEISLLKEERRALRAELELRESLINEQRTRLWAGFEDLQRSSGLPRSNLIVLDAPELPSNLRAEWRRSISELERIEMATSTSVRKGQSTMQLQQRAEELLRLGTACYYLGQYERALAHYGRAIELVPNDSQALINHSVVNHALRRHQPALQDLEMALKLEETAWAYLYRGMIRESLGEDNRAMEDFTKALRLDSNFVEGYYRRGLLYSKQGEHEKSFQDQNKVLELDENHAGAYTARGVARAALGDSQWALNDLDKGCTLAPQWHEGFYHRGRVRHQLEMYDEALADYARAIELNQTFAQVFMARGKTHGALGEHWQAVADFGQVIELEPKNAEAHYARGVARSAMREYRRAIEDFERALELDPGMAVALADRGAAYEKLGEYANAIRDLDRAIALDPNLAIAYYNRGLAYGSKGEYDRASRDLDKAVKLDPSLGSREKGLLGPESA